ncbi:histidinol-phosphate aminotransferase family protein [Muricauda sp. SCSIO 64092]|uniref:pyridoxal phosphate-dependent aminotransferase n=1 Tax=Allomuricauda sp. SCSIO 64092 TaxID=2908842 RepID=UPI001FF42496|nr:histidinol-phosphate transaminase [Muricauda sp. SCSIO 64092]UOY09122.1 histidinol-phosphate aminotransferase family protein [Muricauda sp. SCSIO 64092]
MTSIKINRRNWLKTSALTAGGLMASPYLGFSKNLSLPLELDAEGNALYSPFFKEYLLESSREFPILEAKLNANENPYGPSPMALEALKKSASGGNRYAWKELFQLRDKIADFEGVTPKNIMMGPGSSDLLEKTAMVLFMNGGNVVSADPAYMSLIRVAEAAGGTWKPVPLNEDWSHDLEAMEKAIDSETKLVYICNPNNPTGTITDAKKLLDFCSRVSEKVPVFVDEAYLWFLEDGAKQSMVSLIKEEKDIIVARTFSKIHGMAGLRVGYALAQEATLDKLQRITRAGMGISYPSVYAAMAAMEDHEFLDKSRKLNAEARDYVFKSLQEMGFEPVASHTSFMIFPIDMEGKGFLQKMTEQKVGVRAFQFMDKNWCRVSMGTMEEMKLFTAALRKVFV